MKASHAYYSLISHTPHWRKQLAATEESDDIQGHWCLAMQIMAVLHGFALFGEGDIGLSRL